MDDPSPTGSMGLTISLSFLFGALLIGLGSLATDRSDLLFRVALSPFAFTDADWTVVAAALFWPLVGLMASLRQRVLGLVLLCTHAVGIGWFVWPDRAPDAVSELGANLPIPLAFLILYTAGLALLMAKLLRRGKGG